MMIQSAVRIPGVAAIMSDLAGYFNQCDEDHDGRIFYKEFLVLLNCLGRPAPRDLYDEFHSLDMRRQNSIDIQDFFTWWMK